MKAIVFTDNQKYSLQKVAIKQPQQGEVKVKLKTAGLNRRDLFLINESATPDQHFILGSDGAGIIEELGVGVTNCQVSDEVIINPSLDWNKANKTPDIPQILGGPTDGTFAEYVIVPCKNIIAKPDFLSWTEAGSLSLAALTAYRALFTKGQLTYGKHLFIPGVSGGVATYALLFAKAIGARVTVTSRDEIKLKKAEQLGADRLLKTTDDWSKELENDKADVILDSIGEVLFSQYLAVLKANGNLVNFGRSSGDIVELSLSNLFFSQFNILGTSMGSKEEFEQMIQFLTTHHIKPIIDRTFDLQNFKKAIKHMETSRQFGNIAISIN